MSEKFRELDSDRLFTTKREPTTRSCDMESQMPAGAERDCEKNLGEQKEKPFICCEYARDGNSCGAMHSS